MLEPQQSQNVPKANVREKIVDAALHLFHTQGYNGSGVNDIVVSAGVPKGSFYNHFASKEALGLETIARYWRDYDIDALSDRSVPPLSRLRAHFEKMADVFRACGFLRGCLLGNFGAEMADANPAIREALSATTAAWITAIADVLREARDQGSLPADKNVRSVRPLHDGCLGGLPHSREGDEGSCRLGRFLRRHVRLPAEVALSGNPTHPLLGRDARHIGVALHDEHAGRSDERYALRGRAGRAGDRDGGRLAIGEDRVEPDRVGGPGHERRDR